MILRRATRSAAAGLLVLAAGLARAATGPPAEPGPFPSPEALRQLGDQPHPTLETKSFVSVPSWTLQGPFPEKVGEKPIRDPGPFERLLVEEAKERAGLVVVSESMRCVAREAGLFFVKHGALPNGELRRFLLGRCGASGANALFGDWYQDVPPDATPEHVLESPEWQATVRSMLRQGLGPGPRAAGIWFGRKGNRALVMLVSAERGARVTPFSTVPGPDGRVRVQGEVLAPAGGISASVNQGPLGWADCEEAPGTSLPRFDLSCPVKKSDETAWLDVSVRRPGRLLGEPVLDVLVRPSGAEARAWTRRSFGPALVVSGSDDFRARLLERVNALRKSLGRAPLALENDESASAARLAPIFFAAMHGMAPSEYGDMVALGLMAGWKVNGLIRNAAMGSALAVGSLDVDRWLAEALSSPALRSVLLDPACSRLAVGPLVSKESDHEFLAAVVASYETFGHEDEASLRQDLYARLDQAYEDHHMHFPLRERAVEAAMERELLRIAKGETTPQQSLKVVMQEASARLGVSVHGWLLDGDSIANLRLPDALFAEPASHIAAGVTHVKSPGDAWGHTLVLLVTAPENRTRTARVDARR